MQKVHRLSSYHIRATGVVHLHVLTVGRHCLRRQRRPRGVRWVRCIVQRSTVLAISIVVEAKGHLVGTLGIVRPSLSRGISHDEQFGARGNITNRTTLVPSKAVLASVYQLPVGRVDARRDLRQSGISGVETRGHVASGVTERGMDLSIGSGKREEQQ